MNQITDHRPQTTDHRPQTTDDHPSSVVHRLSSISLLLLLIACSVACQMTPDAEEHAVRGGRLVVAQPAGPRTFNPLFADDTDSLTLAGCLMATLIRINRQTQETELELAESATWSPDGRVMTARLRPDIRFSDGQPLTVEDILFTFQVIYDPNIASSIRDLLQRGGEKIAVEKVDDRTVRFTFPGPYAAADRLFSGVHILPKHVLERSYREGKFESAWGLSTPPEQVIGLGPYRLQAYEQGQRTVLVRNPHYWKRAAEGASLPYLDRIDFLIIPDRSARLLKFQQGELDLLQSIRPEDVAALRTLLDRGEVAVYDLGPSLITDFLWFNLNPGTDPRPKTQDPRPQTNNNGPATSDQRPATKYVDPVKLAWFSDTRFRQAVAYAINRQEIADVVFSGAATPLYGPVTPGEKTWYDPSVKTYPHAPGQAKKLLSQMGFQDFDVDGMLEDEEGRPVAFTLLTNAGNQLREKMSLMIQEDLKQVGIEVTFVPMESKTLLSKIGASYDYEACLLGLVSDDTDPDAKLNFLLSSGTSHWWTPSQPSPLTAWEARIDELMTAQARTLDRAERKKLFAEVQQIMAEQVPFIYLVSRNLIVAARQRVGNLKPAVLHDFLLWNSEELYKTETVMK